MRSKVKFVWVGMLCFLGVAGLVLFDVGCSPTPSNEATSETSSTEGGVASEVATTPDSGGSESTGSVADTGGGVETSAKDDNSPKDQGPPPERSTPPAKTACTGFWPDVTKSYSDATNLKSCDGIAAAEPVVKSLMNLTNISISNNGQKMTPCVEARCDDKWVYVVTNALPHYDFVQTTPNALNASTLFYRVAMKKEAIASGVDAEDFASMKGCEGAYSQFQTDPSQGTNREPSGYCTANANDKAYMTATDGGKKVTYRKISCLGTVGFAITGVPVFGPNEGPRPDAWGNPVFFHPDKAGDPYVPPGFRGGAALDLCMGHTAQTMHYHGFNEACFERKSDGSPKLSYAAATSTWDYKASLTADCKKESGIVGWSQDGVPIKGPCVCVKRDNDGSCASVKRARSGFVYRGLKAWGTGNNALDKEGTSCAQLSDCCPNANDCHYHCKYTVVGDKSAPGGSSVSKRCVLRDYTWCVHHFVDRSSQDVSGTNFVYLDRCNGYEGPDGYAYYATTTFPHIVGCTKYESKDAKGTGAGHGGGGGGGGNNRCRRDQDCPQNQRCQQGQCRARGGGGPKPCTENSDCKDACPPGSKGCTCHQNPQGQKICAPTCTTSSDCPQGGPNTLICGREKVCIPRR